ncbi:MAG: NAD-dependent epimerase/dehydratase family protein [Crenarchaeota archaeon]|nr:NAD-dependent epimerase/dehydratase family protein [Thermoproteota archaeon]
MKVLVLGGTGAMGAHLVHLLRVKSHDIFVTSRSAQSSAGKVRFLQGNAQKIEFLQKLLQHPFDVTIDFMVYRTTNFKERAELLLKSTKQYIFLSSARVYANEEHPITESSPRLLDITEDVQYLATDEYALAKARQENILRNSGYNNWTIIRPYITYSENRLQLGVSEKEDWLYRALKGRTIFFPEDILNKKTSLTYSLDVSKAISELAGNSGALNKTYNIAINEKESKTWCDILNIYFEVFEKIIGYRPKISMQNLNNFLKIRPIGAKYQVLYDRMFDRNFNNSKIESFACIDNFTKTETGLKKCLESFLKNPQFKDIDWKIQAKMDKMSKEKASLSEIPGIKQKIKYLLFRYGKN